MTHAVAFAVLVGQDDPGGDHVIHPGLVGEDDGVGGVFFEWMVFANDVDFRGDQVVVDEKLPGAGQVAHRLSGSHTRRAEAGRQEKSCRDPGEETLITAHR